MFVSNPESFLSVYAWRISCGRNPFSTFILSCVCFFVFECVVCIASVADPNTVQIDRMITALKQLLLGLDSLSRFHVSSASASVSIRPWWMRGWQHESLSFYLFFLCLHHSLLHSSKSGWESPFSMRGDLWPYRGRHNQHRRKGTDQVMEEV